MAKKFRVAFVGAGGIAQGAHFPGWKALPDCEIVAIADVRRETALAAAEKAGIGEDMIFEDYKKMLESVEADIVDVCTPNCYHKDPVIAAFKAGCHVIVEKPIGVSRKEAEQMTEAGHNAGKLFMVAQSMRFQDNSLAMKDWVDAGYVGDIYWARASYLRQRGVPAWGAFIVKEMSAGGPGYDLGVHILDLCLHLMGHPEPVSVSAGMWLELANKPSLMKHDPKKYTVPEEFVAGFVRFANGAAISLETSWALNVPEGSGAIVLAGTKGGMQNSPLTLVREEAGMLMNATPAINPYAGIASHSEEIRRFVEAIKSGGPSPVPGEQAIMTQRILDGLYTSAQKGKEVKV
ncbi:MAG: Gfo/Idh/MocA family oxidoreductase [Armatimonadetes bacterium]|nr:Gfo/Idh/MocA family oxidoreductase [Armatimonadota bacterium]